MSNFARYLSLAIGFLSLSQEILWVKLISFIHETLPQAFSFVLMFYLFGIALGAEIGKRLCARVKNLYAATVVILIIAGVLDALLPLSVAFTVWHDNDELNRLSLLFSTLHQAFAVTVTSMLKSIIFPIAHHLGTVENQGKVGVSVSKVYFFNVIGSTLGPLVTGFYLLNVLDLQSCFLLLSTFTLIVAFACGIKAGASRKYALPLVGVITIASMAVSWMAPEILITKITTQDYAGTASKAKHLIQNRHGIIQTYEGGKLGDVVFGGNTFDGRFNTSLVVNSNGINRAYVIAAFHPQPKRVLMIGLSSASWAKVISGIEGVEHIDIVEINPGYVKLVELYSEVSSILSDKRIHIHIDDGRRWLKTHSDRYDLVVMNTTWHWKNFTSNLLSADFLQLVKKHMNPGAVLFYNSTGSSDVLKTARHVFKHAYMYVNFVAAADVDIKRNVDSLRGHVYKLHLDGQHALLLARDEDRKAVDKMFAVPFVSLEEAQAKTPRPLEIITDQNMLTEYKYGRDF